jgi:hypothetical protein
VTGRSYAADTRLTHQAFRSGAPVVRPVGVPAARDPQIASQPETTDASRQPRSASSE